MAPPKTFKGGDPKKQSKAIVSNADPKKTKVAPTASERKRRQESHVAANASKDAEVQCDDPNNVGEPNIVDKAVEVETDNQNNVDKSKDAEVVDKGLEVDVGKETNVEKANDGEADDGNNIDKADHCEQDNDESGQVSENSEGDEGSCENEDGSDEVSSENEDDGDEEGGDQEDDSADGSKEGNEGSAGEKNIDKVSAESKLGKKQACQLRAEVKLDLNQSRLYQSFNSHVASLLLRPKVKDRGPLSCKQHTRKLKSWNLEEEHPSVIELVKNSPLYRLMGCSYKAANRVLISAFVERWHGETNTFHMSFGEMGIGLDDVHQNNRFTHYW